MKNHSQNCQTLGFNLLNNFITCKKFKASLNTKKIIFKKIIDFFCTSNILLKTVENPYFIDYLIIFII